jgi:hypothetical protein
MDEKPSKENQDKEQEHWFVPTRIWSFVWRGAVGGVLGSVIFFVYLFYADTYRLNALETTVLIAAVNGLLIGAFIFFLGRLLGKDLGIWLRIITGVLLSFCSMGVFSYLAGGFYGDVRWFVSNVILLALTFGGFAGALATGKSPAMN